MAYLARVHKYKTHVRARRHTGHLEKILAGLVGTLFADRQAPVIIAIGGPGGTGKSMLGGQLRAELGDAAVLALDDYKTARDLRQNRSIYGPHPDANKLALIREHLVKVRAGALFEKPVYCADAGDAITTAPFKPARFTILDGEVATYRDFRDLVDFSIFVDSDWTTQLKTRLSRDIDERGYSTDKAIATFLHSNLREFATYGAESKKWADVHVHCRDSYRLDLESVAQEHVPILESLLPDDMEPIRMEGLIVPVCTPFGESGGIDERGLVEHLEYLSARGVTRILVNGTTAEFFSLLPGERQQLLGVARRYFPGMVMFNTGSDSLPQAKEAARWAEDYGADAMVAMTPYYYAGAGEDGLVAFLNELGEAVDIPMVLYNFSRHTGNALTPAILAQVTHLAVKDSDKDLSLIPATSCYLAGSSKAMIETAAAGARGFVSALANVMPETYVDLEAALLSGETGRAQALQDEIKAKASNFTSPNEIACIKRDLARQIPHYPTAMRLPLQGA